MFSYLCLLFTAYPIGAHAFSFTLQLMLWLVYGSALARQQAQAASLAYFSRIRTRYAVMCRTCTARYGFGGTGSGITIHVRAERETADRRAGVRELSSGPEDEKISRVPVGPGPPTPHHNRTRSRFFQSRHRDRPSRRRGDSNVLLGGCTYFDPICAARTLIGARLKPDYT